MTNPYQPPPRVAESGKHFGDFARLIRGGFLYREIQFSQPVPFHFVYSGWNFVQRIRIDGITVWRRISWAVIHREVSFQLPRHVDGQERSGELRIVFTRSLRIHRFQIWIGGVLVWDE